MWAFIKKIFSERDGDVTVVVLDDQNPDGSSSFKLAAADIIKMSLILVFVSVIITTSIFFATPLGSLYQHQQDETLRQEVIGISERVLALQDSLIARDMQLNNMKDVLRTVPDTTFAVEYISELQPRSSMLPGGYDNIQVRAYDMLSQNEVIFSGNLERSPDFPSAYPVRGTLSQRFSAEDGHFGIDIAAQSGSEFTALADGVVIYTDWTINYGHVLYLQHSNGIITVYKHGSKIYKQQGNFVLKGDILGEVADRGVLSTGSHLHLEVWRNGVPQDPIMYLIN